MQLAAMRFTKIEGTAVSVTVTSAEEAKAALKELRHKKRELKFLRGALVRKRKGARAQQIRNAKRPSGASGSFLDDVRWASAALVDQVTVPRASGAAQSGRDRGRGAHASTRRCTISRAASCSSRASC